MGARSVRVCSRPPIFAGRAAAATAAVFVRSQADVHDHMEYILTSLDMIAGITENLINYTFNVRLFFCPPQVSGAAYGVTLRWHRMR